MSHAKPVNQTSNMNFFLILILTIFFFTVGYCFSIWKNKNKLEVIRARGVIDFIYSYCERLHDRCDLVLEKMETGTFEDKEKVVYAAMLKTHTNIVEDLVEVANAFENKLAGLLQGEIGERVAFGRRLDRKIKNLAAVEDGLTGEGTIEDFEHITESLRQVEVIKVLVNDYLNHSDDFIKNAAIEAAALMDVKGNILNILEECLKAGENAPGKETKELLERQAIQTTRFVNSIKHLFGS